jgi:acetylornithine deacetylase
VGTIRGGAAVNIVPDRCEIEVDRRLVAGETAAAIRAEFQRHLDALAAADPDFHADIEDLEWYPPFEEDPDGPVARLVCGACRAVLGRADLAAVPWSANVGVFRAAGIPCVLFGPGEIADAHTAAESIALADVARAAEVYAEVIRRF